jgi:hypothetical protein
MGRWSAAARECPRERLANRQIGYVEFLTAKARVFKALNIRHPPYTSCDRLKVQLPVCVIWRRAKKNIAIETVPHPFRLVTDQESVPEYHSEFGPMRASDRSSTPDQDCQATNETKIAEMRPQFLYLLPVLMRQA